MRSETASVACKRVEIIRKENALNYNEYRETLRWLTDGDRLFRDGMDHYEMETRRFERAIKTIGTLTGKTVCDCGSFPGYGLWAFKECRRYIGLGKCPEWYKEELLNRFKVEWQDCDFESVSSVPILDDTVDIVTLQEVIEHIRKPKAFLTALYDSMPLGAKLYLTTNNIHYIGYVLKLAAGKEIFDPATSEDAVYPGHCTYYSLGGLSHFVSDLGFTVLSARRVNFLPESRFYRNRLFAKIKNGLTTSLPHKYATHIEVLCQKR